MLWRHWEKAEGTIVAKTPAKNQGSSNTWSRTMYDYAVDVKLASGETFRAEVHTPTVMTDFWQPEVGDPVGVEVDTKSRKVKFDKSDPRLSVKEHLKASGEESQDAFAQILAQQPDQLPGGDEAGSAT
jgi:hypothetical protein